MDEEYASSGQSLIDLLAYDNQFSGLLPSVWNTPNLERIDLGINNYTGTIPQDLWDLPSLQSLIVDDNQLTGPLPSLSTSNTLKNVWLYSNQLSGSIPSNFGINWSNLTSLKIQNNDLTGNITPDHCNRWPASTRESLDEWRLEADCNLPTMGCACCTECFPSTSDEPRR
jgi:hypothetical protein